MRRSSWAHWLALVAFTFASIVGPAHAGLKGIAKPTVLENPTFTGTISGAVQVLAQSWAAVSGAADTNENTLATITIPANTLGANGAIKVEAHFTVTNSANDKTLRIRLGGISGTVVATTLLTTSNQVRVEVQVTNRNATNSQVASPYISNAGSLAVVTAAVDTTAATTVVITGQKETAGETITLEGYTAEVLRP